MSRFERLPPERATKRFPRVLYQPLLPSNLVERDVVDRVILPAVKVEVPPFIWVDGESCGLHQVTQLVAVAAFLVGAAGVVGRCAVGKFVKARRHRDLL